MFRFLSLNLLIFLPILASAIIMSPMFGANPIYIRRFSKTFATIHFLYSLLFVVFYNISAGDFYDEVTIFGQGWLNKLGISAAFGLDGLSVLLVAITSFIFLIALIFSKTIIRTKQKLYYTLIFLLESALLGTFCAKDMFVFLLFWEAELIPLYFLISEWSGEKAKKSAMKYILTSFIASSLIFCAMIGLYYYGYYANGELSSSIDFLRVSQGDSVFPLFLQKMLFWAFFAGFAIKLPIAPLHTLCADVIAEAPSPISILISTISLNVAAYGIIRFDFDLFPELFTQYAPIIMTIGCISLIWFVLSAYMQKDIKKIVAYSCFSYMGLFLIGLSSLEQIGIDGAFLDLMARSLIITGLFLIIGLVQQTAKTKSIQEIQGVGAALPKLKFFGYIIFFSAINIPFTIGFPAQLMTITGTFVADYENQLLPKIIALCIILSLIFSATYLAKMFHVIFCGNVNKKYNDITGHRLVIVCIICICIILLGLFPDYICGIFGDVVNNLLEILRG
jgi:proton-translocating NADH-quinone oxidoreductase chain M